MQYPVPLPPGTEYVPPAPQAAVFDLHAWVFFAVAPVPDRLCAQPIKR
jgi:hypothetical protein